MMGKLYCSSCINSLGSKDHNLMYHSFSLRSICIALLPLLFLFVACDSGGSSGEDDIDNQFTFTIEPASSSGTTVEQQQEVSGFSFFVEAEDSEMEEEVFAVYLDDGESFSAESASQGLFGWIALDASQPGTGEYNFNSDGQVTANEFGAVLWEDVQNPQVAPFYVVEGGTLTISESSDDKVAGSIDATGTKVTITTSGSSEEPVTITGSFTAEDIETFVELSNPGV